MTRFTKLRGSRTAKGRQAVQVAALRAELEELRRAQRPSRDRKRIAAISDYEWHVELAAKGLARRDKFPMPTGVTTAGGFYEVMAGAALDATGFRDLLERVAWAERSLEGIQDALRSADAKAENARHRKMPDEKAPWEASISDLNL